MYLGAHFTVPVDVPDLPQYQGVEMFHSCTDPEIKEFFVLSVTFPFKGSNSLWDGSVLSGCLSDCAYTYMGAPGDVESYIQHHQ